MGLTTKEIGSSSFNDMISSVDRRSEYVENRANANVTLNNFLTPYTLDNKSSILNAPCGYSNGKYASLRPEYKILPQGLSNLDTIIYQSGWQNNNDGSITFDINNGTGSEATQIGVLQVGKTYKFSYDINFTGAGQLRLYTQNFLASVVDQSGTYTGTFVADGTNIRFKRINGNLFTIDNVSVKEVQEADFDFSRGSSATRVNDKGLIEDVTKLGSELVTNGNFDTDSDWALRFVVIEDGVAKFQESVGTYARVRQDTGFIGQAKVTYTISFNNTSITTMSLRSYGGGVVGNVPATVGTHTLYVDFIGSAISFQSGNLAAGEEIHLDNVSVKEVIDSTDIPRIDYTSGQGALLLEPQSTNKVTQSETFSTWSTTNASITSANLAAPDGSTSVIKMSSSGIGGGEHKVRFNVDTNPATSSIFAKMGEVRYIMNRRQTPATSWQSVVFDLQEGVVAANNYSSNAYPKITHYGNGWYRCEVYYPSVNNNETGWGLSNGTDQNYSATNTTDGLYIWGAQQEDLSYATSYIPTEGSTVTRNAELADNSGNADLINSTEGVLYAEIAALANSGNKRRISLSDGTDLNGVILSLPIPDDVIKILIKSGGAIQANSTDTVVITATDFNKIAAKYKAGDFALWVGGTKVFTDSSGSAPIGLNELSFNFNGGENFYGKTKDLKVFKRAMSDSELYLLTKLSGDANNLMLAGDTAQSIAEGVAFRFTDVRQIFFNSFGGIEPNLLQLTQLKPWSPELQPVEGLLGSFPCRHDLLGSRFAGHARRVRERHL